MQYNFKFTKEKKMNNPKNDALKKRKSKRRIFLQKRETLLSELIFVIYVIIMTITLLMYP